VQKPFASPPLPPTPARAGRSTRRRRRAALRWGAVYLLVLGGTLLGYVGYQLWGTGIYTARAQSLIRQEIRSHGFPARPVPGGAVGFIKISRIDLDMAFVQGVDSSDLAKGPGHYPSTPLPGDPGNVVIAGHRTTHRAPFWSIDALGPGDEIMLQTRRGTFLYRVEWVRVVEPDDVWVSRRTRKPSLTLTTCFPRFSQRERLVVRALQVYGPSPRGFVDQRYPGFTPLSP
jgi:sortase A